MRSQGLGFFLNSTANFVPERRRAFQRVDGNPDLLLLGKEARSHIGPITHVLRDLQDTHPGHRVNAGMVVQGPVHRACGYSEGVGYVKKCYAAAGAHLFLRNQCTGLWCGRNRTEPAPRVYVSE